jgi:hypothetical protein
VPVTSKYEVLVLACVVPYLYRISTLAQSSSSTLEQELMQIPSTLCRNLSSAKQQRITGIISSIGVILLCILAAV